MSRECGVEPVVRPTGAPRTRQRAVIVSDSAVRGLGGTTPIAAAESPERRGCRSPHVRAGKGRGLRRLGPDPNLAPVSSRLDTAGLSPNSVRRRSPADRGSGCVGAIGREAARTRVPPSERKGANRPAVRGANVRQSELVNATAATGDALRAPRVGAGCRRAELRRRLRHADVGGCPSREPFAVGGPAGPLTVAARRGSRSPPPWRAAGRSKRREPDQRRRHDRGGRSSWPCGRPSSSSPCWSSRSLRLMPGSSGGANDSIGPRPAGRLRGNRRRRHGLNPGGGPVGAASGATLGGRAATAGAGVSPSAARAALDACADRAGRHLFIPPSRRP